MIEVSFKSDILGSGVFWEGSEKQISEIRNIPARMMAEQVVADGEERKDGMWTVRKINTEEFEQQYLGEFKPDPIISECIAFLQYATPEMIADYKRKGLFTNEDIKTARQILEADNQPKRSQEK
jgi:hypothetical protein